MLLSAALSRKDSSLAGHDPRLGVPSGISTGEVGFGAPDPTCPRVARCRRQVYGMFIPRKIGLEDCDDSSPALAMPFATCARLTCLLLRSNGDKFEVFAYHYEISPLPPSTPLNRRYCVGPASVSLAPALSLSKQLAYQLTWVVALHFVIPVPLMPLQPCSTAPFAV
jgi:hypothetical protein